MARLFTDGAEFQDLLFWNLVQGGPAITTVGSNVRSGLAAYRYSSGSQYSDKILPATLSEFYFRLGYKRDGATSAGTRIPAWFATSTELGSIRLNTTTHFLEHYVGTTLTTMGTIQIPVSAHCVVEVHVKIGDAPNGIVETKVDGIPDISFAGDSKPGADAAANMLRVYSMVSSGMNIDDLALNDITGAVDNSWCGEGRVAFLKGNANGDVSQLVGQDGNSVDNYLNIDDVPHDGDTTYNQGILSGEYDLYNLQASGLSNVSILRGWIEARARKTKASPETVLLGLKTDGTEYWNDSHNLMTMVTGIRRDHTINPKTGSPWTIADLDALQIGFKVE